MGNESILLTYLKAVFFCLLVKESQCLLTFLFIQQGITLNLLATCCILIFESVKSVFLSSLRFTLLKFFYLCKLFIRILFENILPCRLISSFYIISILSILFSQLESCLIISVQKVKFYISFFLQSLRLLHFPLLGYLIH